MPRGMVIELIILMFLLISRLTQAAKSICIGDRIKTRITQDGSYGECQSFLG
jgi:hypothetical protein